MEIRNLITQAQGNPNCIVYAAAGPPTTAPGSLPDDLSRFYAMCGGIDLHRSGDYPISIVGPSEFVRAIPVIAGVEGEDDISYNWYIIARNGMQFVTIDCDDSRLGKCYDSFWDQHAIRGSVPIIALSFTELLKRLLSGGGRHWYWLQGGFPSYGDAYDSVKE